MIHRLEQNMKHKVYTASIHTVAEIELTFFTKELRIGEKIKEIYKQKQFQRHSYRSIDIGWGLVVRIREHGNHRNYDGLHAQDRPPPLNRRFLTKKRTYKEPSVHTKNICWTVVSITTEQVSSNIDQ